MKEPVMPIQYSQEMQQYHMYGGETVASMLTALGDQLDYTKCIFEVKHGYYDAIDAIIAVFLLVFLYGFVSSPQLPPAR